MGGSFRDAHRLQEPVGDISVMARPVESLLQAAQRLVNAKVPTPYPIMELLQDFLLE